MAEYNRRDFLKIVGASSGVAAAGCARDVPEKLIPYVVQPEEIIPGVASWYSASCNECGAGCGTLVRTREGRVVKVEGNSEHPVNRGGLCAIGQSSVQGLYDPDRVREPLKRQENGSFKPISWKEAIGAVSEAIAATSKAGGKTLLVTKPLSGSEHTLSDYFLKQIKGSERVEFSLFDRTVLDDAAEQVFGAGTSLHFDFSKADVVVGFGADYLETWLSPVEFARGFSRGRVPKKGGGISKVVHVEPRLSLTAANADTWLMNRPGSEAAILLALLSVVVEKKGSGVAAPIARLAKSVDVEKILKGCGVTKEQVVGVASDLLKAKSSLVVAGGAAIRSKHEKDCVVLANLLNVVLGNVGQSVILRRSTLAKVRQANLQNDTKDAGVIIVAGVNPAFALPASAGAKKALTTGGLLVSLATHLDETSRLANIVLPLSSSFEAWSDSEPAPGVFNLSQPAMQPLYETQGYGDTLLALLVSESLSKPVDGVTNFYDYIRAEWRKRVGEAGFDAKWDQFVERGGDWSTKPQQVASSLAASATTLNKGALELSGISLLAFPTVHFGDGSSANRSWMQEIPDPMTTTVWGSWVEMHPDMAGTNGLKHGQVVQVAVAGGAIEAPVFVTSHIHPELVALPLGQGHVGLGRYSSGVGTNPISVLSQSESGRSEFLATGVNLRKSISRDELVVTQGHDSQLDRGILRRVNVGELDNGVHDEGHAEGQPDDSHQNSKSDEATHAKGEGEHAGGHHDPHALGPREPAKQMYEQMEHVQYRWGMSIDLSSCTGCTACVAACYAENNVPTVGKEFCAEGREMSWLRIHRYIDGPAEQPVTGFIPMMCQHCGNAPCEPVCPVYATYHSDEGLNTMVYNRCVGTRYCANNCSYKVRRFNWYQYSWPEPLNWQLNPDVSQRSVGVMEKCSFCIQRIREGENTAKDLGRPVKDGEIQPACASSCPTQAIKFGNLKDHESEVFEESQSARGYKVLDFELNTQPAVTYLAKVTHDKHPKKHG